MISDYKVIDPLSPYSNALKKIEESRRIKIFKQAEVFIEENTYS